MPTTQKITVSLPGQVVQIIDSLAKARQTSRSTLMAELLKARLKELEDEAMKEGYLAMAKENLAFAKAAAPLAKEVWPEWK